MKAILRPRLLQRPRHHRHRHGLWIHARRCSPRLHHGSSLTMTTMKVILRPRLLQWPSQHRHRHRHRYRRWIHGRRCSPRFQLGSNLMVEMMIRVILRPSILLLWQRLVSTRRWFPASPEYPRWPRLSPPSRAAPVWSIGRTIEGSDTMIYMEVEKKPHGGMGMIDMEGKSTEI